MSYWAPGGARRTARERPHSPHLGILGFSEPDVTGQPPQGRRQVQPQAPSSLVAGGQVKEA